MNKIKRKIKKIKLKDLLFAFLIILLVIPRLIVFITKEDYFGGDYAFYYFLTKTIVVDHEFPLLGHVIGELGGFSQGAGWSYILTIPFLIFDGNPVGGKVYMLFVSLLIITLGGFISWKYFSKKEALLITTLLGVSPYLIRWTTHVWPPYTVPLITILYLFLLILFLKSNKPKYFLAAVASISLMAHFEVASLALFIPGFTVLTAYFVYKKMIYIKTVLKSFLISGLFFIPHLIYDINHNFYNIKGIIGVLVPNARGNHIGFQSVLADRLHLFKTDIIAVFPISDYRIIVIIFIFFLLGYLLFIKDKKVKKWKKILTTHLLLIIPLTFIGTSLIPVERASFWWFTYLTVIYIFFAGIIMGYLLNRNILFKIFVIIIFSFTIYSSFNNYKKISSEEKKLRNIEYEIGIQAPIEYIYNDSRNKPFIVLYITGNNKVTDYKYMFWYIGRSKHSDSQALNNLDLNFTSSNGSPVLINENDQFYNLKKGTYYIIISDSLPNSYYNKVTGGKSIGSLTSIRRIKNGTKSFIVEKRIIK